MKNVRVTMQEQKIDTPELKSNEKVEVSLV